MTDRARILVVAATERELAPSVGWRTLRCGVGPVDAAAATAAAIALDPPAAILHVGIAGARRTSGLAPATIVIGTESRYCDISVSSKWAPDIVAAAPSLLAAAGRALPNSMQMSIGTSARVGGTAGCEIEAMEGFAVLRAAQLAGIPAIEIRVISNDIEERDRSRWHFDAAFAAITGITPRLVEEFTRA